MKRLTIVKADNTVYIDGKARIVDCSSLPENFHALQWYEDELFGEIEMDGRPKPPNVEINNIQDYQSFIDAWYVEDARVKALEEELQNSQQNVSTEQSSTQV